MAQVTIVKFGAAQTLDIEEGTTLAEALEEAGIDPTATVRFRGESVEGEQRDLIALVGGENVVVTPPAVNHG